MITIPTERFEYLGYEIDRVARRLTCRYALGDRTFVEEATLEGSGPLDVSPEVDAAARLVFLLAGVSYYKTAAPPVVDLGRTVTTDAERHFLRELYVDGLAEMAHRNGLDLSGLRVVGPTAGGTAATTADGTAGGTAATTADDTATGTTADDTATTERRPIRRPLVPFGGGIDSIVTVEEVRAVHPDLSLFVVNRPGDRFAAIEQAAGATGLPVIRAERRIDPAVLRSSELGFLNGHVPVTGILSALAVLAAAASGHDAVVMANEWSASSATVVVDGRPVNHQWSKSFGFERGFRQRVDESLGGTVDYFSLLRPRSELWVAERFARLDRYHHLFRSCNRAFHLDPARRLDRWCGTCDKCCFIDLLLAPFVDRTTLESVFDGAEPLADAGLIDRFRALLGAGSTEKPFECVGDVEESRVAASLAVARPDRAGTAVLHALVDELGAPPDVARWNGILGPHFVPEDLLGSGAAS